MDANPELMTNFMADMKWKNMKPILDGVDYNTISRQTYNNLYKPPFSIEGMIFDTPNWVLVLEYWA